MWLDLLRMVVQDGTYRTVLDTLAQEICAASVRVDHAMATGGPDWREAVIDEECDLVEELLGTAFITCQTQITSITSQALNLRQEALNADEIAFSAFDGTKEGLRSLGDPLDPPATASRVDMIWALANYFKHRDEWHVDWSKLDRQAKRTAEVVKQVGLRTCCTGNLRRGAEALGNPNYTELWVFADIIDKWGGVIYAAVKKELEVSYR
jgi:hypothetical protein